MIVKNFKELMLRFSLEIKSWKILWKYWLLYILLYVLVKNILFGEVYLVMLIIDML